MRMRLLSVTYKRVPSEEMATSYGQSKLAQVMHLKELKRRLRLERAAHLELTACSAPGELTSLRPLKRFGRASEQITMRSATRSLTCSTPHSSRCNFFQVEWIDFVRQKIANVASYD